MAENWIVLDIGNGEVFKGSGCVMNKKFKVTERTDVSTTSRLWVWWLVKVRGYQVRQETNEPKAGAFGNVRVVRRWFLNEPKTVVYLNKDHTG
jgi:hypothetical protein